MHNFNFKESDKEGLETLMAISHADSFNKWMYNTVSPFLKGSIIEIGSGIGNISKYFINDKRSITLSDVRDNYCLLLQNYFSKEKVHPEILKMDLSDPSFTTIYNQHLEKYDSLLALNVIEHIKDDSLALRNANTLIKKGGSLVVLVPAFPFLYNNIDKDLLHYRRYDKKQLLGKLVSAGFLPEKSFYFNSLGVLGWLFSGSMLRKRAITNLEMSIFNRLVPLAGFLDRLTANRIGLSLIVVGRKA